MVVGFLVAGFLVARFLVTGCSFVEQNGKYNQQPSNQKPRNPATKVKETKFGIIQLIFP